MDIIRVCWGILAWGNAKISIHYGECSWYQQMMVVLMAYYVQRIISLLLSCYGYSRWIRDDIIPTELSQPSTLPKFITSYFHYPRALDFSQRYDLTHCNWGNSNTTCPTPETTHSTQTLSSPFLYKHDCTSLPFPRYPIGIDHTLVHVGRLLAVHLSRTAVFIWSALKVLKGEFLDSISSLPCMVVQGPRFTYHAYATAAMHTAIKCYSLP